jgi:hypothetical protein
VSFSPRSLHLTPRGPARSRPWWRISQNMPPTRVLPPSLPHSLFAPYPVLITSQLQPPCMPCALIWRDTSQVKTWGGEESDGSAGGGVKRGRKLFLQGRGEHRFIAVVIRIVRSISIVIIALLPYVTIRWYCSGGKELELSWRLCAEPKALATR